MITIKDIALYANVSPSTVSRCVRKLNSVSKEKRLKVEKAIKELGYVPNLNASSLKSNTSNIIGIILPSEHNLFFSTLVNKLNEAFKPYKKLMVLYASDFEEVKNDIYTLISLQANSILFIPEYKSHTIKTLSTSTDCYFLQLFIDIFPQFDSLIVDDKNGTYLAVKELIKNGHRKILLIDGNNDVFLQRRMGIIAAYQEENIPFQEESVLSLNSMTDCEEKMFERIQSFSPTAIVCVTELLAQKLCKKLQIMGLSIPNDISLIVYDDSPWAELCGYSAINQPVDSIVKKIEELVNKKIVNEEKINISKEKIKFEPLLIKRNSIKNIKGANHGYSKIQ